MNNAQRLVVITALVLIGAVLAWLLLDWEDGWQSGLPVLVFYDAQLPNYQNLTGHYGIYARYGVPPILAILFGAVLPLSLFAVAAFLAFGRRKT